MLQYIHKRKYYETSNDTFRFWHIIAFAIVLLFALPNCSDTEEALALKGTIGHFGFDFSAGASDTVDWDNNDGEVIGWFPGSGSHPTYPNNNGYVWYRNDQVEPLDYKTKTVDLGTVDFENVTDIPTVWDTVPNRMLVGHTMVVKCKDGYAMFKIDAVDEPAWEVDVTYQFTTGSKLDNTFLLLK